ncbi:MAG: hypothetical protein IPM37_13875 [Hahellaceae bacterium]|nr:hypothetical protein [Hahellaceae bacterium]
MSQNLTLTHSFKQSLLWIVVTCIIALVVLFLAITSSPPNHMPVRIIEYDEKAALTHYKKNYIFDFTSFMRSFDQNRNGKIEISEWTIELHAGVASILNPAQSLQALDRLTKEAALQEIETRYESILDQIRTAQDPREQYWKFDIQAQYLARKHQLIPESILGIIDNKGKRLIHGAEDLPPLLSWDKINPQLFEVPWPPGNVAISQLKNQIRVFLTPFPDANFSDIQIYELQLENGQLTPYPPNQLDLQRKLRNSLGIEAHQGRLYIVDHGAYGVHSGRLVVVDLQTDQLLLN